MLGASMLEALPFQEEEPLVKVAYQICRWHHERYDGSGYPDGLKGERIPISAQAVSLADVYDALTGKRVYKRPVSHAEALEMIFSGKCGAFNPLLLECLRDIGDQVEEKLCNDSLRPGSKGMWDATAEILQHEELTVSERTLRLLEHERTKYRFFASMSQEIQFEYTTAPPMLTISDWGARRLSLGEIIMEPEKDRAFLAVIGMKSFHSLVALLKEATPERPVAQLDCEMQINGEKRWSRIVCRTMWSAGDPHWSGVIGKVVDIHEEHLQMADLQHRASHDALTGLANHTYAQELIRQKMKKHPEGSFALAILDLDHFKTANDNYGHAFGDQVLKYMADKLRSSIRGEDIAARVGGDEFLIFLECKIDVEAVVERIFRALTGEFNGFTISVSMGVAKTENAGKEYDQLFHHADQALYAVKRSGRGQCRFYDDSMQGMLSVISSIDF